MRKHQINVLIQRVTRPFKKISEESIEDLLKRREKDKDYNPVFLGNVYADANNIYEALCAAFNETMIVINVNKDIHRRLDAEENLVFTNEKEVIISICYSELLNPHLISSPKFYAASKNIYEALSNAFNQVLYEIQKLVDLPSVGCKEHTINQK